MLMPDEPDEPKYAVGQWAVYECGDTQKLIQMTYDDVKFSRAEPQVFRPAVPADFDVKVGNMTVRAYDAGENSICSTQVVWSDGSYNWLSPAVAAALGYPICPLTVSGGKYESPKGEK